MSILELFARRSVYRTVYCETRQPGPGPQGYAYCAQFLPPFDVVGAGIESRSIPVVMKPMFAVPAVKPVGIPVEAGQIPYEPLNQLNLS